jgi:hypothetical protein
MEGRSVASHRTLPVIAERFTIGRVLVQSWRAFVAGWRWYLPVAVVVSTMAVLYAQIGGDADAYRSRWSFVTAMWISGVIQSLAIAPITLGILGSGDARSEIARSLRNWIVAIKIAITVCIQQVLIYWPMVLMVGDVPVWRTPLIGYLVFVVNAVVVGTLIKLFYPIFLVEQCSLWQSAIRSVRQVMPQVWRMGALCVLYWLVYFGGTAIVVLLVHSFGASTFDWSYNVLFWPLWVILVLAGNIVAAVAYHLLRLEREGPDPAHVAGVFE